jgi:cytochrome c556
MKTWVKICILGTVLAMSGTLAYAQFAKPREAIMYRQSVMFLIGQHFGRMGAMVKGVQPYAKEVFSKNAAIVNMLSTLPWEAFQKPGTDQGPTKMNASALQEPARFQADATAFETQIQKLVSIADTGNFDAAKVQFGQAAKSCKACHDAFRK